MHPDITKTIAALRVDDTHAAAAGTLGCGPAAAGLRRLGGVRITGTMEHWRRR